MFVAVTFIDYYLVTWVLLCTELAPRVLIKIMNAIGIAPLQGQAQVA